jgi:hypothetical protein
VHGDTAACDTQHIVHLGPAIGFWVLAGDMIYVLFEDAKVTSGGTMARLAGRNISAKNSLSPLVGAGSLLREIDHDSFGRCGCDHGCRQCKQEEKSFHFDPFGYLVFLKKIWMILS